MARFLIVRTAATEWDEEDRIRGDFDVPLSSAGRHELEQRLREVTRYNFRQCWAGTDQPADETAQAIGLATGCRVRHHPGLREVHQGLWQGLLRSDVRRKHRRVYAEWLDDPERICPASGEPLATAARRVQGALRDIDRRGRQDELIALVCGPLTGALAHCLITGRPLGAVLQVVDAMAAVDLPEPGAGPESPAAVATPGPNGQNGRPETTP